MSMMSNQHHASKYLDTITLVSSLCEDTQDKFPTYGLYRSVPNALLLAQRKTAISLRANSSIKRRKLLILAAGRDSTSDSSQLATRPHSSTTAGAAAELLRWNLFRAVYRAKTSYKCLRNASHFDINFYMTSNNLHPALRSIAIFHYVLVGEKQGLEPHADFSPVEYLSMYPDIHDFPAGPYCHFIEYGMREGRLGRASKVGYRARSRVDS